MLQTNQLQPGFFLHCHTVSTVKLTKEITVYEDIIWRAGNNQYHKEVHFWYIYLLYLQQVLDIKET